jgi:hypothetical protein
MSSRVVAWRIVCALGDTIRLMGEVDAVIEVHGV